MPSELIKIDWVKDQVEHQLNQTYQWFYSDSTGSTNNDLLALKQANAIAITEDQTQGRGQRNNQWQSSRAENLLFSLSVYTNTSESLGLIPIKVGLAVKAALNKLGYSDIQLKWPNDIYYRGKKLGGILIESIFQESQMLCIIGVGININRQNNPKNPFATLKTKSDLDRSPILIECLTHILTSIKQSQSQTVSEFNDAHLFHLKSIAFNHDNKTTQGLCQGINSLGQLQIETHQGIKLFSNGSIDMSQHALS